MTPRIPPMAYREVHRLLLNHGFSAIRRTGGHVIYHGPSGRRTVVPRHAGDIDPRLIKRILKETGIDADSVRR